VEDTHRLGYHEVDDDANVDVLLGTMDATGEWPAVRELRAWERRQLGLRPGQRLLDVGCGLGDAALALAADLGDDGDVVGIDSSSAMVATANARAAGVRCRARFAVGDACSLDETDDSFDAVRSERTLQWIADPLTAVREIARVVRPGGRVSLIDTDWSTFTIDVSDAWVTELVRDAFATERRRPSNVGRRLHLLAADAGLTVLARTEATHHWTSWDPDVDAAPAGCFSMRSVADDLVEAGQLTPAQGDEFLSTIERAARSGRFAMRLTMHAVVAG
jgi:SAM-dependent methyltransferase